MSRLGQFPRLTQSNVTETAVPPPQFTIRNGRSLPSFPHCPGGGNGRTKQSRSTPVTAPYSYGFTPLPKQALSGFTIDDSPFVIVSRLNTSVSPTSGRSGRWLTAPAPGPGGWCSCRKPIYAKKSVMELDIAPAAYHSSPTCIPP